MANNNQDNINALIDNLRDNIYEAIDQSVINLHLLQEEGWQVD